MTNLSDLAVWRSSQTAAYGENMNNLIIGRTTTNGQVFELQNGTNPHLRYFDTELKNEQLVELWELTQNDVRTHQTNLQFPVKKRHLEIARKNKKLLETGESIYRMRYFWRNAVASVNESQEGQICRIARRISDNYYLLENARGEQFKGSDLSNLD